MEIETPREYIEEIQILIDPPDVSLAVIDENLGMKLHLDRQEEKQNKRKLQKTVF